MMYMSYSGVYELLEIEEVNLISKYSELGQLPAVMEAFLQAKVRCFGNTVVNICPILIILRIM